MRWLKSHGAEVTAQQAVQIESQRNINSELVKQLKTNQEKVELLEKKDVEREKQLQSMQNEVERHQQKVFEIEAKLNVESGKTMALTMQLADRDLSSKKNMSNSLKKRKIS